VTAAQPSRIITTVQPTTAARPRRRARTSTVSARSLRRAGIAVATAATLLLMAYIAEYASLAKASHESARLQSELRRARQENSNLHARVEVLERPERIDHLARAMSMEQRNDADYAALAPLPAPKPVVAERPMLAGFLPERLVSAWRK
jgi:cell division protein FtsL